MNGIVSFRLCTLTDSDLAKKVDSLTDEMYLTGKIHSRHVPARPDNDYDLLVGELVKRFYERIDTKTEPDVMNPYLKDRADGVKGHYCIARKHPDGYTEYWNDELKKWCSSASVFELGAAT